MDDFKLIGGMFLLAALMFAAAFISPYIGDGLEPDDIYERMIKTQVTNYSDQNHERYVYSVNFEIMNVSSSFVGSQLDIKYYSGNKLITNDDIYNNTTMTIGEHTYTDEFKSLHGFGDLWTDEYYNITSCELDIVKDGKVVFNLTKPFNTYVSDEPNFGESSDDTSDSYTSSSNKESTYVASSDSNKFHYPYCTQAKRIKDSNKITFSSRDEAINTGYEPCGICYP